MPLPALLFPDHLLFPVLGYFELLAGNVLLAILGVNMGFFASLRHAAPRAPGWGRFEAWSGVVGLVLAVAGGIASRPLLAIIGFAVAVAAVESALWQRESECRYLLQPPRAPHRR